MLPVVVFGVEKELIFARTATFGANVSLKGAVPGTISARET